MPSLWTSMGQFSPIENFFTPKVMSFFVKSYAILHTKSIEEKLCWCTHFFDRYVMLLLAWWKEYKAISSTMRVGRDDFCNFYLWRADSFSNLNSVFFGRHVSLHLDGKAVSSSVRVSQHRFYVKHTPFLCETTLSSCGRSCIFVDGSVSLGTAPFAFSIVQRNFSCVFL